jgi:hypothetical protein
MLSLTNFAAEIEREKARQPTHDALVRTAQAGHVTGGTVYRSTPEASEAERARLERELRQLDAECVHLADAIAGGDTLQTLVEALRTRERRRADLRAQLEHLDGLTRAAASVDPGRIARECRRRVTDWHGLLEREPIQARQILRELLPGKIVLTPRPELLQPVYEFEGPTTYSRLVFTPKGEGRERYYEFAGPGTLDKVITGLALPMKMVPPVENPQLCPGYFRGTVIAAA